ncbi:hypothetical protein FACS1894127_6090 [Clostridia bacterium]|nr:hypothetical protein FACS1894127_6090 [Clostridia bacterium]
MKITRQKEAVFDIIFLAATAVMELNHEQSTNNQIFAMALSRYNDFYFLACWHNTFDS